MNDLQLDRPLAFFDIESTGINRKTDRIIDLAVVKLLPDGGQKQDHFRLNPERPIPPEAQAVHHISDDDVKNAPTFKEKAEEILKVFEGCDLAGFNILRFDVPLLQEEFKRVGVSFSLVGRRIIDAQRIFHRMEPRDLTAALAFYCGEEHTGAHGALDDVLATIKVFEGQLKRYPDLPRDPDQLNTFCNPEAANWADQSGKFKWDSEGDPVVNFGKYQSRKLSDLAQTERGFLQWILRNDFPADTQDLVRNALAGNPIRRAPSTPTEPTP